VEAVGDVLVRSHLWISGMEEKMTWSNVCVEGFCFGETDEQGNYPCGRYSPSCLCLENKICPHFAYSETMERMIAEFPPLRLILWDRLGIWMEDIRWRLRWWFWDCLWFNRRKVDKFFNNIGSASSKDYPGLAEFEEEEKQSEIEFKEWFKKVSGGKDDRRSENLQ